MNHELTALADRDIAAILSETAVTFGPRQLAAYAAIIDRGVMMVAEDPQRPGSIDRSEIRPDLRLFHLELAVGRRGAAAHCLYCTPGKLSDGSEGVIILRVLHQHMEPPR